MAAAIAAISLVLGGCAKTSNSLTPLASAQPETETSQVAASDTRSELQKATEYWGKAYSKSPRDAQTAINFARNLKALGEKQQALAVLQQASLSNGSHRGINGEYGRLALELEQVSIANKLLEQADDPANPDWRIISARGTVLAKQGKYREAIGFYERALTLAPDQASVLNNLALAHAMEGNAEKAEPLLKRAVVAGGHEARINQNLAIVLSLQGKYEEAKLLAARDLPADNAAANVDYLRRMVRLEPKPITTASIPQAKSGAENPSAQQPRKPTKQAAKAPTTRTETSKAVIQSESTAQVPKDSTAGDRAEATVAWQTQVAVTK
jgi:Flp pilus assembly protein TadD